MAEGINISYPEVTATASSIRSTNQALTAALNEVRNVMNGLDANWQGDSANDTKNRFNALVPKFERYREKVDNYAKFLDNQVSRYSGADATR